MAEMGQEWPSSWGSSSLLMVPLGVGLQGIARASTQTPSSLEVLFLKAICMLS